MIFPTKGEGGRAKKGSGRLMDLYREPGSKKGQKKKTHGP